MAYVSTTVGQVIQEAAGMAQMDSGFYPLVRGFYNRTLEKYSKNINWPFYRKVGTDVLLTPSVTNFDLPEDFAKEDDLYLINPNGGRGQQIIIMEPYAFDQLNLGQGATYPTLAMIDQNLEQLVFNHAAGANSNYSYRLAYYRLPVAIDTEGANDDDIPDFNDIDLLIEAITSRCMKYMDDERQQSQMQIEKSNQRDAQVNAYEQVAPKIQLAATTFTPGRRSTRGGGSFGGFGGND